MNGVNTELAKNLILCGTNIVICDSETITEDDVETNFLISPNDLGKNVNQKHTIPLSELLHELFPLSLNCSIELLPLSLSCSPLEFIRGACFFRNFYWREFTYQIPHLSHSFSYIAFFLERRDHLLKAP